MKIWNEIEINQRFRIKDKIENILEICGKIERNLRLGEEIENELKVRGNKNGLEFEINLKTYWKNKVKLEISVSLCDKKKLKMSRRLGAKVKYIYHLGQK